MHGLKHIVQFNWPFYAAAIAVAVAVPSGAARLPLPWLIRTSAYAGSVLVVFWIAASLVASWIVYDCSRLMEWDWVLQALGFSPKSWINLHAGVDESTPALRAIFRDASGRVFDIFDPVEMTEPSIGRARRLVRLRALRELRRGQRADLEAEQVDYRHLPVDTGTVDVATLMLSAHELRSDTARGALFTELRRVLGPGGRVIVAEHLRDWANFLAFGPGVLHFHSRPDVDAVFLAASLRHSPRVFDHAVRARVRPAEAHMRIDLSVLLVNLRAAGVLIAALVVVNLFVPSRFGWRTDLSRVSLVNRQIYLTGVFGVALWCVERQR